MNATLTYALSEPTAMHLPHSNGQAFRRLSVNTILFLLTFCSFSENKQKKSLACPASSEEVMCLWPYRMPVNLLNLPALPNEASKSLSKLNT